MERVIYNIVISKAIMLYTFNLQPKPPTVGRQMDQPITGKLLLNCSFVRISNNLWRSCPSSTHTLAGPTTGLQRNLTSVN